MGRHGEGKSQFSSYNYGVEGERDMETTGATGRKTSGGDSEKEKEKERE